ncbi:MAG: hypothetical protein HYX68_08420 [Planctomycetes bacterium]|jgi:hypothetical protein|nr:hypothetical protein [Planctomycetota bacterium]
MARRRRRDDEDEDDTGVEIKTEFFPLAFILFLFTPKIEIDDDVYSAQWGTRFFPLEPGKYTIRIYFPYIFMPRCGENRIKIRVREGEVARIKYYAPLIMFMPGTINEVD